MRGFNLNISHLWLNWEIMWCIISDLMMSIDWNLNDLDWLLDIILLFMVILAWDLDVASLVVWLGLMMLRGWDLDVSWLRLLAICNILWML